MGERMGLSKEDAMQVAGLVEMIKKYPRPAGGVSLEDVVTGAGVPEDFKDMLGEIDIILYQYPEEVRRQIMLRELLPIFGIQTIVPPPAD